MADDSWRRGRDDEDFGPPLFGDEPTGEVRHSELSFGDGDTGPLPHWTAPPTGEMPRIRVKDEPADAEEVDVWSSFADEGPVWSDDAPAVAPGPADLSLPTERMEPSGSVPVIPAAERSMEIPVRREPGRITIGTDPTNGESRTAPSGRRRAADVGRGARRPVPPRSGGKTVPPKGGRDLPTAVAVGLGIAAVFIGALMWRPEAALAVVIAVLGLAAVEYFDKITEKGYQPATLVGILACLALPIGAWAVGVHALPLVVVLAFAAAAAIFASNRGIESNPLPNAAVTSLGVTWIGLMGAYAALILSLSKHGGTAGTDTLTLIAVGVVANDVGAYFVGSAFGKTPLRAWISPNKSVEGLIGGTIATIAALMVVRGLDLSDSWTSTKHVLLLAVVIAIFAPLGDLTESMFKRNLDIKDFGTLVRGHGGVLDRFDGFLFVLPAAYYLMVVLFPGVANYR